MRALCRKLLVTCITFQMGMSQASTSWMCQHKMYATRWENISQCCCWISCFLLSGSSQQVEYRLTLMFCRCLFAEVDGDNPPLFVLTGSWSCSSHKGVKFWGRERSSFHLYSTPFLCFTGWVSVSTISSGVYMLKWCCSLTECETLTSTVNCCYLPKPQNVF